MRTDLQTKQSQDATESLNTPYETGGKILAVMGFLIIMSIASVCSAAVLMRVIFLGTK